MITYNEQVLRRWILGDKTLTAHFQRIQKELKSTNTSDPYGKIAVSRVYYQVICKDTGLFDYYKELIRYIDYVPDSELVDLLILQMKTYGWDRFFTALRLAIKKLLKQCMVESVTSRKFEKAIEKLQEVPDKVNL